jgi:roadblock/LC7 domain-containing protein
MKTPEIKPYVTAKGGVVVLNGPFPLDEAKKVAEFCAASPRLFKALARLTKVLKSNQHMPGSYFVKDNAEYADALAVLAELGA